MTPCLEGSLAGLPRRGGGVTRAAYGARGPPSLHRDKAACGSRASIVPVTSTPIPQKTHRAASANAARCIRQRAAPHPPTHRTASANAPHRIHFLGRTQAASRHSCLLQAASPCPRLPVSPWPPLGSFPATGPPGIRRPYGHSTRERPFPAFSPHRSARRGCQFKISSPKCHFNDNKALTLQGETRMLL